MPALRASRAPQAAGAFVALAVAAAAGVAAGLWSLQGLFLLVAVGITLAALAYLAVVLDPAWPISGGLALSIFSGNWAYTGVPGALPLDRLLLGLGLISLAWRTLRERRLRHYRLEPVHLVLVLAAAYAVGSALWAGTLLAPRGLFALLDRFGFVPIALFVLAPIAFNTVRRRNILLVTLVATGGYLGLTALFETLNLNALVFPRYILDPDIGLHPERARGPFIEGVGMGLALFISGLASCLAVATWRSPLARLVAAAVVALCAIGVLFTLTRSIWLGSVVATLVTLLVIPQLRRYFVPVVGGGVVIALLALALVPGLLGLVQQRGTAERPIWDRANSNVAALRMLAERPLLGHGWDTFREASPPYFRQQPDYPLTGVGIPIHNVFLSNAVELGLVGTAIWLAGLLMAIGGALARRAPPALEPWRIGLVAVTITWLAAANLGPLGYAFPNAMLWLWAGIASAWRQPGFFAVEEHEGSEAPEVELMRPVRILAGDNVPFSFDTTSVAVSTERIAVRDPDGLLGNEEVMLSLWPWDGEPPLQVLGRVEGPGPAGVKRIRVEQAEPDDAERLRELVDPFGLADDATPVEDARRS